MELELALVAIQKCLVPLHDYLGSYTKKLWLHTHKKIFGFNDNCCLKFKRKKCLKIYQILINCDFKKEIIKISFMQVCFIVI